MTNLSPARAASLLAGGSALLAGLAPAVANLDTTSTAGVLGGVVAVLGVLREFLKGQRAHEARVARVAAPTAPVVLGGSSVGGSSLNWPAATAGDDGDDALPPELDGVTAEQDSPPDGIDVAGPVST